MSIILYSRSRRRRFPEGQDSLTAIAKWRLQSAKSFSPSFHSCSGIGVKPTKYS